MSINSANREAEATDEGGRRSPCARRPATRGTPSWACRDASPADLLRPALQDPAVPDDRQRRRRPIRGMDLEVHQADGWDCYQNFSLWDTYRTQATLHALLLPERAGHRALDVPAPRRGRLAALVARRAGDQHHGGRPRDALAVRGELRARHRPRRHRGRAVGLPPRERHDDPAGRRRVRRAAQHRVLRRARPRAVLPRERGRPSAKFEEYRHGGSATLELALADASLGAAAERASEGGQAFLDKGRNWRNLWNPDVELPAASRAWSTRSARRASSSRCPS